jgi:hypothetical protein
MKTDPRGVSHHIMTITLGIIGILVMAVSGYSQDLADPAKLQPRRAEERALERILRTSSKPKSARMGVRAMGRMMDDDFDYQEDLERLTERLEYLRRLSPPDINDEVPF